MAAGLQSPRLTIFHLNVTTLDYMVLYSLSTKEAAALAGSLRLREVVLDKCLWVMDVGLVKVAVGCPGLERLAVKWCMEISDIGIDFLTKKKCKDLRVLDISYLEVTNQSMCLISTLRKLQVLTMVRCCDIDDEGLGYLNNGCNSLQMVIFMKTAHCIRNGVHVRSKICSALSNAKPSLMMLADDALYRNEDVASWYKNELIHENVFDNIYSQCSKEDREVLQQSLQSGKTLRDFRSEVALSVEPCMKVGALKSLLKVQSWILSKNLVLLQEKGSSPLANDSATLVDCDIKGGDSVLACMGGSFTMTVCDFDPELNDEFVIPVSSCFEMVGDLKKKIHKKLGKDLDKTFLHYQFRLSA